MPEAVDAIAPEEAAEEERLVAELELAGVRYLGVETEVSVQNVKSIDVEDNNYDAILVLRPKVALSKYWYLDTTLSAGAGDSDLVWEAYPQLVYECCGWDFRVGYRSMNYEWESGNGDEFEMSFQGPVVGVGFSF